MKRSTVFTWLAVLVLMPATLLLGRYLPGRGYYLTATLLVVYMLIPFFLAFEGKKPDARELALIAVMCALAVASRAVFFWLPNFKPIYAIIILSAMVFGPQAGFLVGAISAFASNFLFGQGPWTPWQMLAYGMCGCIAGLFYHKKQRLPKDPLSLGLFGFTVVLFVVCPLLDTSSVITNLTVFTPASVLAVYLTGLPVNLIQAACTFVFLLLLSKPLLTKLQRIVIKYGIIQ